MSRRRGGLSGCSAGSLALMAVLGVLFFGGGTAAENQPAGPKVARDAGRKVVVVGIPGVGWTDIAKARLPAFEGLLRSGAPANVSVRMSNRVGDGYLSLGAGRRADAGLDAGLALGSGEQGSGDAAGRAAGIAVLPIGEIKQINKSAGWSARPGLLAETLSKRGLRTAAIGNADTELGPLPATLAVNRDRAAAGEDTGLHREVALAAMDSEGRVAAGSVGRDLLEADPSAPFGIATSVSALLAAFGEAKAHADAIFVETGDSARADLHSLSLPEEQRAAARHAGLVRVDRQIAALLQHVDLSITLLIVVAPTTPGGPGRRGQLRPVVISGPGFIAGVLESPGTRRRGLVTMQDLSATIGRFLGASDGTLGSGHAVRSVRRSGAVESLIEMNSRAATSDALRTPFSFALIALDVAIFLLGLLYLREGRLPGWLRLLLLAALCFPLLSHLTGSPVWRLGPGGAAAATVVATLLAAAGLLLIQAGKGPAATVLVPAAAVVFFLADLALGAPVQMDAIFGYTSVSGGRYYGLGNLGFAIFASSSVLLAGSLAELFPRRGRWLGMAVVGITVVWIGYPDLGADVGGTLAMACTAFVLAMGLFNRRPFSRRDVLLLAAAAVVTASLFAWIDLSRPPAERSHWGEFISGFADDPAASWPVLRRKAESSATFGLIPWGLLVPVAVLVFAMLRRHADVWARLVQRRPFFRPTLKAMMVAAVAGSVLNDSGVVVGGMVLALAVPWALLSAADSGAWSRAEPAADDPGNETAKEIPALPRPV